MDAGLPQRDPIAPTVRALGFAGFCVFVAIGLAMRLPGQPALCGLGAALALVAGALLARSEGAATLPLAALATAAIAMLGTAQASNVGWFGLCLLGAWCLYAGGTRVGVAYWLGSLLLVGSEWLLATHDPGWGAWAVGVSFTMLATFAFRRERLLVQELRAAQSGLAERERSRERNRIARELHDVIAHSLTVSLLHVASARLAVEHDDPQDAARALAEAERLGRESLGEARNIMGVLRPDGANRELAPVPGVDGVPELVERFRTAGADVSLERSGPLETLPHTLGSTVYRIVQESLTNAGKHAPRSHVEVRLLARESSVEVLIENTAGESSTLGGSTRGAGLGLVAMRERAEALGGSCETGPAQRGWRVHAILPRHADGLAASVPEPRT